MNSKIKDALGIAAVLAMLLLAYAGVRYAKSAVPGAYREFSATGEGKIVSVPDVAQFNFSVVTEGGKDLAALQSENTGKVSKAIDLVKSKGVEAKDIKTGSYSVEPRYQYYNCSSVYGSKAEPCPPATIEGYTITESVTVKVRDFSKVGEIMSGVVESGANQVGGLVFTIDDPEKVKSQAREEAIREAREKAEAVAKAGGFRIGKIIAIEENGSGYYYPDYLSARGGADYESSVKALPAAPIEPGSQDVTVSVVMRFEIK